ncbi:Smr/MutS family protein [Treponema sp.]|uniref:Smr/MutS family protein n=1 Tax=Treponema sp. TaxID=166 RepID=UPI003F0A0944
MDFGDILSQWDSIQSQKPQHKKNQVSHKKANAPTKEEKEALRQGYSYEQIMQNESKQRINPMELWLRRYGTVDKDREIEENARLEKLNNINYLKSIPPEATLDLHQLTREEAWDKLKIFVDSCCIKKLRKILIIHGKGNHSHGSDPVLGQLVRIFIEQDKRLGTSGHPDRNHGGTGATWVIIKA